MKNGTPKEPPSRTSAQSKGWYVGLVVLAAFSLCGCEDLRIHDTSSLLLPRFQRSEVVGLVAGVGTTFAALPDLLAMLRRRSSQGMNPTMAGIMGVFQVLWIYYGLLIVSRPVVVWNTIAVVINFLSVGAYVRFARREKNRAMINTANPHSRSGL